MQPLPRTAACFACGDAHPSGLGLEFATDGEIVRCTWFTRPDQAGFARAVHGGLIATVLDEGMAWACGILGGYFAYSVELKVRFHRVLTPGSEPVCTAALAAPPSSRMMSTTATLALGDVVIASATGKYMPIREFNDGDVRAEFGAGADAILRCLEKARP